MPTPFLSSEEYDERAHQLYNEGQYDEALDVLREGLGLYPNSVELHIGVGYAHHAREDYAWARRSFEEALVLDPDHEDALAGLGETLLKFGQQESALKSFRHTLELGYQDDVELMLQIGRALFREGLIDESKQVFETAAQRTPGAAEAVRCIGYAEHRLGNDETAISTLRRALQMDPDHTEARIYLGNIFYDRGDYEAALYHLDRSTTILSSVHGRTGSVIWLATSTTSTKCWRKSRRSSWTRHKARRKGSSSCSARSFPALLK